MTLPPSDPPPVPPPDTPPPVPPEQTPPKPKMARWKLVVALVIGIPVGLLALLVVIGLLMPDTPESDPEATDPTAEATTEEPTTQEPTTEPSPDPTTPEPTTEPEPTTTTPSPEPGPTADLGEEIYQALLDAFAVDSFRDLTPDMWAYYITEVTVSGDMARIHLQVSDHDGLEGSSRAAFSLIGAQFPDLDWVIMVDAAGVDFDQTHRADVPLLN